MRYETERLIIRDFVSEDWLDVHKYASNTVVTKYTMWGPNSEAETRAYVDGQIEKQRLNDRTDHEFAVELKRSGALIGGCGIYLNGRNAEIGYSFNPDYWGNGFATEAARAMLALAFGKFKAHRVFATCRPGNTASANVMRRLGMKQEGHLREHLYFKGAYHDSYLFSILSHEWGS